MSETQIATVTAQIYTAAGTSWNPVTAGIATICFAANLEANTTRIVALENGQACINTFILPGMTSGKLTDTFGQFRDSSGQIFGLNFTTAQDASKFDEEFQEALRRAAQPPPAPAPVVAPAPVKTPEPQPAQTSAAPAQERSAPAAALAAAVMAGGQSRLKPAAEKSSPATQPQSNSHTSHAPHSSPATHSNHALHSSSASHGGHAGHSSPATHSSPAGHSGHAAPAAAAVDTKQIAALEAKVRELEGSLRTAEGSLRSVEASLRASENEVSNLHREVDGLRDENEKLRTALASNSQNAKQWQQQVEQLRTVYQKKIEDAGGHLEAALAVLRK